MNLRVGQTVELRSVKFAAEEDGYECTVRGDVLDITLPTENQFARILWNGDRIEDIKIVDATTLKSVKKVAEISISANLEFSLMLSNLKTKCPALDFGGRTEPDAILPNYYSAVSILADDISHIKDKTVLIFVGNSRACENYLSEKKIDFVIAAETVTPKKINIVRETFPASFELKKPELLVYSLTANHAQKNPTVNLLTKEKTEFLTPQIGECVVHSFHGIGRFMGVKKMTVTDKEEEYFILQYDGGTHVYLPVSRVSMLSNYVGEPTRLHKIGGQDFANAKQRVRHRLRELSFKLGELYKKRAGARANRYEFDEEVNQAFADAFEFPLTADQEKTLADIIADMKSNKIMDRLICGDVGYGKTEIAFRAAFAAIMNGYQVMLLCPTTILSVQHFNLALKRFAPFGVRVAVFNRFVTDKEATKTCEDLSSGEIDLIIGTHKLLSLSVGNFKNLGMLILDEEQRFGVEAKEKIKKMTQNIDILTITATPIPRTLNISLIGLRDISVITTPPKDRLPVKTTVCEFSWDLLTKAISNEKLRGGQVIILYNNVETIAEFTNKVKQHLLNVKISFLHGQMPSNTIEDVITKLYEGEIDVIVASTIIENGIDISTANTLFVINADKLGIAQMHQLRGRVGRGNVQAYAYFTYANKDYVSEIAMERLTAIKNFYSTGAGFNIAMRDLELRGSGEVLGANQSGHIDEIGMTAFAEILQETVDSLPREF